MKWFLNPPRIKSTQCIGLNFLRTVTRAMLIQYSDLIFLQLSEETELLMLR